MGFSLHGEVVKRGFGLDGYICIGLIDMYYKFGYTEFAREVFNKMSERDVVAWNAMIFGYSQVGDPKETLKVFREIMGIVLRLWRFSKLTRENVRHNQVQIVGALSTTIDLRDIEKGKEIHDYLIQRGTSSDSEVITTLITMYAKCGNLNLAKELFNEISTLKLGKSIHGYVMKVDMGMGLDVLIRTALVAMYVKCGCFSHAKL
ncbi:pentatricopeptide repeat-containing protein At1g11290, chloroplastic [Amborella trichopoda]|uniref:pentatricopeptide repeat-containing protein At1g11290, chloroplastic n=1 Tax=Amborella trichopoda TaxID=13333 RepID=UPI0005D35414|nr:pentatricopeptide repeat-containing protein At1g11290, chloroplastic [Amborella trichopoda]|eukprot:XP_006848055.2 pentatricopeptide repeat-containing protein At1g11290, chloroplastic [Amborella trichopoda]